jgi:hypothetical protein
LRGSSAPLPSRWRRSLMSLYWRSISASSSELYVLPLLRSLSLPLEEEDGVGAISTAGDLSRMREAEGEGEGWRLSRERERSRDLERVRARGSFTCSDMVSMAGLGDLFSIPKLEV